MHRENSTLDVWEGRIKNHLEADWKDVPIEQITIESVNEWAWKKRKAGTSWGTIKDVLRTMQRVLSAFSKDGKPPFSQHGLRIPERDKLQMKIHSRKKVSYSWPRAVQIAEYILKMDSLRERQRYATMILLESASGLRPSELLALRLNDIDIEASTVRVDEAVDRTGGVGPCKNAAAYRTVLLRDAEGQKAVRELKRFLLGNEGAPSNALVFHTKHGTPIQETTLPKQCLHPAVKALGLPKSGMHALRRGCNRRWELAGINPAVLRQQMGHSSSAMTALYTGEIPLERIQAEFSSRFGNKIDVLEKMENEVTA